MIFFQLQNVMTVSANDYVVQQCNLMCEQCEGLLLIQMYSNANVNSNVKSTASYKYSSVLLFPLSL